MGTVAKSKDGRLGARMRELREAAGYTQVEVADAVGVSEQTYVRWERGGSEPTFTDLCVIATMFGKTPNDFAPGDGEEQG